MGIKKKIRKAIKEAYIWYWTNIAGVKKNRVVFMSFNGNSYSDNPKAISEALHKARPDIEIVWVFADPGKKKIVPSYVKTVDMASTVAYNKALYTCRVFVTNFLMPKIKKQKKQFFIQTWHGDRAFKKVLLDATHPHVNEQEEGYCDLAVAGSDYGERQYRSAFAYRGRVLKIGTPRDDRYIDPNAEEIKTLREKIGVPTGKKILLYAPTLRDRATHEGKKQQAQDVDIYRALDALNEKYNEEWVCLVRAHPNVIGLSGIELSDRVVDVSSHEDMSDLLLISDMLITDYSSCAGDFALLKRPVILYQSDIDDYLENTRKLYFDVHESPYYIAKDQDELETIVANLSEEKIEENCKAILDFYGTYESGKASDEVVKIIGEIVNS